VDRFTQYAPRKSTLLPYLESYAVDRSENEGDRAATGSPSRLATSPADQRVLDELLPAACHVTEQYRNNLIEGRLRPLKARLRPMRGLKRLRSAQ
jgi:DDE domain